MYDLIYTDITKIKFNDKIYKLNIAFNRVLKAMDLLNDKKLMDEDKINFCIDLLIDENINLNLSDKNALLTKIIKEFIEQKGKKNDDTKKSMDIKQDFGYIYSSFMKDYNIDLIEQMDKLSWIKFINLLQGLSKDTKMVNVINIRNMKVPELTKYNKEERAEIIRLKKQFRIDEEKEENFQEGLNELFNILSGMAGGGKNAKK